MNQVDALSATFAALADPTRRAILARLGRGEATVRELAEPFTLSPPAITKHLKVLIRAGLIDQGRDRQYRPCRIQAQPLKEASDWADQFRQLWEDRLDRLEAYLQQLQHPMREAAGAASMSTPASTSQRAHRSRGVRAAIKPARQRSAAPTRPSITPTTNPTTPTNRKGRRRG